MGRLRIRDMSNTLRPIVRVRIRDGGVLRPIKQIQLQFFGNLFPLWAPLAVTLTPPTVSGYGSSGASASLTTGSVTAAPVGGTAPFTYAWAIVGSAPYAWTITTPTAATTSFTAASVPPGVATSAEFLVTVTDAGGNSTTGTVTAYANNGQPYDPSVASAGVFGGRNAL